jgi:carbon storage regulator
MLVLTRRPGESIVVGENIVVTVIEIKGGQVRIGIDAPRDIDVYREEIYEQVRQENLSAIANVAEIRKAVQDSPRPLSDQDED